MESLRKWFYRPKKDDKSLLAQFFFADEALNIIATELDSFDGRKDPERCTALVNQLRQSQDKVLTITNAIMDVLIGDERANRDFRVKFPEDVLQENLAGQLWFGAECLAAGSSIMNREAESSAMRPLAKAVTKSLENVRNLLRQACLRNNTPNGPIKLDNNEIVTETLLESLKIFDRLFADFEFSYVSAMVPVKTTQEYELQELISVLFSETLQRALRMRLLTQEMVDDYDPALMFTIPRLAIVSGLLIFPNGPLCIDKPVDEMSEMFRPFRTLLHKIRELLCTLNKRELYMLEKLLCDNEQIGDVKAVSEVDVRDDGDLDDFIGKFYNDYPLCRDYLSNFRGEITVLAKRADGSESDGGAKLEETSAKNLSTSIDIPSTSGYLIANTVDHDSIVASITDCRDTSLKMESPADHDSLEVISVAAATLSTLLCNQQGDEVCANPKKAGKNAKKRTKNNKAATKDVESPDDSGICTENTSLDRSPSLEINDGSKHCDNCNGGGKTVKESHQHHYNSSSNKHGKKEKSAIDSDARSGSSTNKTNVDTKTPTPKKSSTLSVRKHQRSKLCTRRRRPPSDDEDGDDDASSISSSDTTSSFNSNCADDEEIALALQAAEIACRNEVRAKYRSSEDLIHRLFVCIAGVADQLQTNFASDLRNILKSVFLMNATDSSGGGGDVESVNATINGVNSNNNNAMETSSSLEASMEYHPAETEVIENDEFSVDPNILAQEALFDTNVYFHLGENDDGGDADDDANNSYSNHPRQHTTSEHVSSLADDLNRLASLRENANNLQEANPDADRSEIESHRPPTWIPDIEAPKCMSCSANFTVVKRRHHCRNCGKVFCARCSSNNVPLPKYGHNKPVRVCNECFFFHLSPFTM